MKIKDEKLFILKKLVWRENILVPLNEEDEVSMEFIRYYQEWKSNNVANELGGYKISAKIALCVIGENELWDDVSKDLKGDSWSPSTLVLWNLYVQDKKDTIQSVVILPGTLYRDDDLIEWMPIVHYNPRLFHRNILEVSMKHSLELAHMKPRTILISKTKIVKT